MESELRSFVKVWITASICLLYCYFIASRISRIALRLLSFLPVFFVFILLPFKLSSLHLSGLTAFFLVWLANFNLILFAFNRGPLYPPPQNPFHFIALACLPIRIRKIGSRNAQINRNRVTRWFLQAFKICLIAVLFRIYDFYGSDLPKNAILVMYCLQVYLEAEILLAVSAWPARVLLGFEIESQFDEPYLATSLQDFWGRRWNLTVSGILRSTVYFPVRRASERVFGTDLAALLGILSAFAVSGLMHELLYYYATARVAPTWEVTCFFLLHGICTAAEVAVKKKLAAVTGRRWRLHPAVSGPLTVAFVVATGVWLFMPQLVRNHVIEKANGEYMMLVDFSKALLTSIFR